MRGIFGASFGAFVLLAAIGAAVGQDGSRAATPDEEKAIRELIEKSDEPKKLTDFKELTKDAETIDGLFTLHRKDQHLYAEIKPDQLGQRLLAPIAIARGMASAGNPLNFGDEWVLSFRKVGEAVQLVRENIHYTAPDGTPIDKAVQQNYTDSVLLALPILSVNEQNGGALVVDLADVFLTDFAELGLGSLDRERTSWSKVKAFPNNLELEVEATYSGFGGSYYGYYSAGVADSRGITLVIHYSLVKLPEDGYEPRLADDRVGHFISANLDFASENPDGNYVRQINRWRLEKSDPDADLSPPKRQIIWWVEDNVPFEYRPAVEEGILEWNKAFEKIGFRNALAVRWVDPDAGDAFDPEDINYCTFRWITTGSTFAMSGLRADPITGEMIDGDVIFDSSWIEYWKREYAVLTGNPYPAARDGRGPAGPYPIAVGEVISPIMAAKRGYGGPLSIDARRLLAAGKRPEEIPQLVPEGWGPEMLHLRQRLARGRNNSCQYATGMRHQLGLAAVAFAARQEKGDEDKDKDGDKKKDEKEKPTLPEEFLSQAIKEVVMHEVGHSLGLRHNFRASSMLTLKECNDPAVTRQKGMTGSVMDYNPINIATPGHEQGDYATTTIGPYDYWAIEYAYTPIEDDEEETLDEIASRAPEAGLTYGTDEDFMNNDPLVNTYDLGNDPVAYARDRVALASALLEDLDDKVVADGEPWSRARTAFSVLLSEYGNGSYLAAQNVAGQYVTRAHKGDKGATDPIVPVPGSTQREALSFLARSILDDDAFDFSPELLRKLTTERWYHWGEEGFPASGPDVPINERVLAIQEIALDHCLSGDVLARLQDQQYQAADGDEPLTVAEVFRSLTDAVWSELSPDADDPVATSTIRRNLQRAHLKRLATMVLGEQESPYADLYSYVYFYGMTPVPADARSLARLHLKEIRGLIDAGLNREGKPDDATLAHLEECRDRIAKVLDASIEAGGF